jgi:hypothetical protein
MTLGLVFESIVNDLRDALNIGGKTTVQSQHRYHRHVPFAPQVEPLEDRELPATGIGMNLERLSDYMGGWMFTDAVMESRPWIRQDYDTVTGNAVPDFNIPPWTRRRASGTYQKLALGSGASFGMNPNRGVFFQPGGSHAAIPSLVVQPGACPVGGL